MSGANNMEARICDRIALLRSVAPGSIGDQMDYKLISADTENSEYLLSCRTLDWMRNANGTLHGGMCATVVDQAMGFIAFCLMPGRGTAPTVQLQVNYHRPLIPGTEDVQVKVRVISVTKSLMHLTAEAALASAPDKVCITATGTFFYKPAHS